MISAAIAGDDGPVRLAIHPNDQESTIHAAAAADLPGEVVRGVTLASLLDEIELGKIDLLKVDIEGMEIDALTRLRDDQLAEVDQITVEFHDSQGWNDREDRRKVATRLAPRRLRRDPDVRAPLGRRALRAARPALALRAPAGAVRGAARGRPAAHPAPPAPVTTDPVGSAAPTLARRAPLRIAIVSYYMPSGSKMGGGYWTDQYARELVRRGHEVTVLTGCPEMVDAPYATRTIDLPGSMRTFRFAIELKRIDLSGFDVLHANGDDYWCWGRRIPRTCARCTGAALWRRSTSRGPRTGCA